MGMICSYVDIGEPEPVIRQEAVDLWWWPNYSCSLLATTAYHAVERKLGRVGDFLEGERKLLMVYIDPV